MMKSSLVVYLLAVSMVSAAEGGKLRLFILSGQTNMAGLNPNVSFTPAVVEAFGRENVIVVKDAQGGQPIRRWHCGSIVCGIWGRARRVGRV